MSNGVLLVNTARRLQAIIYFSDSQTSDSNRNQTKQTKQNKCLFCLDRGLANKGPDDMGTPDDEILGLKCGQDSSAGFCNRFVSFRNETKLSRRFCSLRLFRMEEEGNM